VRDIARLVDFVLAEARESEDRSLDRASVTEAVTAAVENPILARYWVLADDQGERLLGAIAATTEWSDWQNANYCWISFVYLLPEARGRGLLSALMGQVEETARAERSPELRLYVHSGNVRAVRAYERLGFSDIPYRFMYKRLTRTEAASPEAGGGEVILWTKLHRCPWTLGVWAALREKGIPFQAKTLDPNAGEIRAGEHAQGAWSGKAPALQHGDTWVVESLAILEYLEDVFAPPRHPRILPADPRARARDRQIMSWLRTDLFELRRCLPFQGIFVEVAAPAMTPEAHRQAEKLLAVVTERLQTADAGAPTVADFELCFMVQRLIHYGYDLRRFQDEVTFADRIWNRPSVQSWVETKTRRLAGA
jgi:glutathione S-transferase